MATFDKTKELVSFRKSATKLSLEEHNKIYDIFSQQFGSTALDSLVCLGLMKVNGVKAAKYIQFLNATASKIAAPDELICDDFSIENMNDCQFLTICRFLSIHDIANLESCNRGLFERIRSNPKYITSVAYPTWISYLEFISINDRYPLNLSCVSKLYWRGNDHYNYDHLFNIDTNEFWEKQHGWNQDHIQRLFPTLPFIGNLTHLEYDGFGHHLEYGGFNGANLKSLSLKKVSFKAITEFFRNLYIKNNYISKLEQLSIDSSDHQFNTTLMRFIFFRMNLRELSLTSSGAVISDEIWFNDSCQDIKKYQPLLESFCFSMTSHRRVRRSHAGTGCICNVCLFILKVCKLQTLQLTFRMNAFKDCSKNILNGINDTKLNQIKQLYLWFAATIDASPLLQYFATSSAQLQEIDITVGIQALSSAKKFITTQIQQRNLSQVTLTLLSDSAQQMRHIDLCLLTIMSLIEILKQNPAKRPQFKICIQQNNARTFYPHIFGDLLDAAHNVSDLSVVEMKSMEPGSLGFVPGIEEIETKYLWVTPKIMHIDNEHEYTGTLRFIDASNFTLETPLNYHFLQRVKFIGISMSESNEENRFMYHSMQEHTNECFIDYQKYYLEEHSDEEKQSELDIDDDDEDVLFGMYINHQLHVTQ